MKPTTTSKPRSYRKLWLSLAAVITLSFVVLGLKTGWSFAEKPEAAGALQAAARETVAAE